MNSIARQIETVDREINTVEKNYSPRFKPWAIWDNDITNHFNGLKMKYNAG